MEGCMTERTTRYREPAVLSLGIWSILHHKIKIVSMYWTRVYGKNICYIRPITRVSGNQKMFHYIWSRQVPFSCDFKWMNGKTFQVSNIQYIPRNMHTGFALLCFVVVIHWLIFPYPSGLLHWHCGNLTIAPLPAKQPWWIWIILHVNSLWTIA